MVYGDRNSTKRIKVHRLGGQCANAVVVARDGRSTGAGGGDGLLLGCLCPVFLGDVHRLLCGVALPERMLYLPIVCGIALPASATVSLRFQNLSDCFASALLCPLF